jgi:hypothetical protein
LAWRGSLHFFNFASLSEITGIHTTTPQCQDGIIVAHLRGLRMALMHD